jgi:hypothetical protein
MVASPGGEDRAAREGRRGPLARRPHAPVVRTAARR